MKKFKLLGKDYKCKYTIRALIYFENISGHTFSVNGMMDSIILFYSFLLANNPDEFTMTPDEFIDCIDDNNRLLIEFNTWLVSEQQKQVIEEEKKSKSKKKVNQ